MNLGNTESDLGELVTRSRGAVSRERDGHNTQHALEMNFLRAYLVFSVF